MSQRHNTTRSPLLRRPTDFHHGPPSAAIPPRNVAPASRAADQIAPVAQPLATAPRSPIGREFARLRDDTPEPVQVTATAAANSRPVAAPEVECGPAPAFWAAAAVISATLLLWLYGSTIGSLVAAWSADPDSVHGFLIVPVALLILWRRRELLPAVDGITGWGRLAL
ncbi:MAG: hypothetical protein HY290_14280, partial [Planctomycetia bacterium]|nr:hypothetical protein [Planctomycetia bacterium]